MTPKGMKSSLGNANRAHIERKNLSSCAMDRWGERDLCRESSWVRGNSKKIQGADRQFGG